MASDGSTIGRANIEIGADTSKLDAGLAVAREKVQDSVSGTEALSQEEMALQLQAQALAGEQQLNAVAEERVAIAAIEASTEEELYQAKLQELAVTQELERRERARYIETQKATEVLGSVQSKSKFMSFITGANEGLKETHKIMGAIGRLSLFSALAVGAFNLGRAIREYVIEALKTGKDKAEEFKEALDFSDTDGSIAALSKQLNKLNGEIEEQQNSFYRRFVREGLYQDGIAELKEQRAELEKSIKMLREARQAKKAADQVSADQENLKNQIKELKDQINSLTSSTFGKIEVSVARVAQLVELMANARRNDQ